MFCPTCGAGDQSPEAYCKRCGEWLPNIKGQKLASFGGDTPQQKIFISLFMSALSAFAALFSAIALYATYLGSTDAKWSVYVAAAFCVCIAGWQASSFIVGLKLRQRLKKGRESSMVGSASGQAALSAGEPATFIGSPSVTENTTRTLEPSRFPIRDTQR